MSTKAFLKYILSFFKSRWKLSDYPLEFKHYDLNTSDNPNPDRFKQIKISARIINWYQMSGDGNTENEALDDLKNKFDNFQKENVQLPRPGTKVPLAIAESSGIENYLDLADDFLQKVMSFENPKDVFITDLSSLWDFHCENDNEEYFKKAKQIYNVDISDIEDGNILKIVKRIKNKK